MAETRLTIGGFSNVEGLLGIGEREESSGSVSLRSLAKRAVKRSFALLGFKIVRLGVPDTNDVRDFIPLEETLSAAKSAGLPVGDYIDSVLNKIPSATQDTMDALAHLGAFSSPVETVVEIGPGSGRYLDKTVSLCSPSRYEIYETSAAWAGYLASKYSLLVQPTDGRSLNSTRDRSADLVHAHKVFSTIPFLLTCTYWSEMVRVAKPGGFVVFDIMTEACLAPAIVDDWVDSQSDHGSYPAAMPRSVAIDYFASRGFELNGTFVVPMGVGETEYFVFRNNRSE